MAHCPQSNENEQTTSSAKEEQKEAQWLDPKKTRPTFNLPYEFVTRLGVTHLGYCMSSRPNNERSYARYNTSNHIIFVAESNGADQYFHLDEIEQFRPGSQFPKRRNIGVCMSEYKEHLGIMSEMFLGYLFLRYKEKQYDLQKLLISDTEHYIDEHGIESWVTSFGVVHRAIFAITEIKNSDRFTIRDSSGGEVAQFRSDGYSYKNIANAVEDVLDVAYPKQ